MKTRSFFYLSTLSLSLLLITGCQKRSGNIWEDNQTGAKYSHQNAASLWETSGAPVASDDLLSPVSEEFVPLKDEDLKNQFADGAIPQSSHSLGEGGVPSAEEFSDPKGEMASLFHPLFFNTDDHIIRGQDSLESIHRMAAYLKAHPKTSLIIEGYCDERGAEAYNMALGARRANSVRSMLIKQGVNPDQLHTISFGKEKPFVMGHGPDAWAQNRRAHFRVNSR